MARELRGVGTSGGTQYARILSPAGLWWNGTTFEAYSAGNYATYDVALTEQGSSGLFVGDFPAGITTSGTYEYYVYTQAGGAPAEGDAIAGTGSVDWSGTASVAASTGSMSGSDFYDYLLRLGFKRTDKATEVYEAITDAIQIMRRRFSFDEAKTEKTSTDTITTLGDFKVSIESDLGLLRGVVLEDGTTAVPLIQRTKEQYDDLYPDANVTADRGYPKHYCVFAGSVYIGPIPDAVTYAYRLSYSMRAGTVTSSTTGVPFTNVYRDILANLTLSRLWAALEEYDKAGYHESEYEREMDEALSRERKNSGEGCFTQAYRDI